jgi:predicted enzyme related to lactoylglutathione lyase
VRFLSPPLCFTPEVSEESGPVRYEAFGQAADSEYIVLIERLNVPTPYGVISDEFAISEPLHCSHSVSDLEACSRFMQDVLDHERIFREECEGELFERLMGLPGGTRLRFEMLHHPDFPTGRSIFIEFEGARKAQAPIAPPHRGVNALRYDCDDLDGLIPRIEPAGGAVVRGPMKLESELLGRGRVATVRPPFGVLLEIWEPEESV